jgi:hypothetical protein
MNLRFTNTLLLALIALLTLTGAYGIVWTLNGWMYDVHRITGWALIALVPWKAAISLRSLQRGLDRRFDRSVIVFVSVLLAVATILVLGLAVMWAWRAGPQLIWLGTYADTSISWHWMIALGLLPLFALHAWRRWPRPKRSDILSRRGALKLLAFGAAGVGGWWLAEVLAARRADPASVRRYTGSREQASFSGNAFPLTSGIGEGRIQLEAATWKLMVNGEVTVPRAVSYADILNHRAVEKIATVDCTTGWYSTQTWRGISLMELLELAGIQPAARAVRLRGVSGYAADFGLESAREILLATHVGGEVLSHWHGFPLRAVVPSQRGWLWVKWLTEIVVLTQAHA